MMIIGRFSKRPGNVVLAAVLAAGSLIGSAPVFADDTAQIVVEAKAPVHKQTTNEGAPGGARVDLLSVSYHVHLAGLDLTRHADVLEAQDQIRIAAKRACAAIQAEYPVRQMSDEQSCVNDTVSRGLAQLKGMTPAAAQTK